MIYWMSGLESVDHGDHASFRAGVVSCRIAGMCVMNRPFEKLDLVAHVG